jgi:hypothetical protein
LSERINFRVRIPTEERFSVNGYTDSDGTPTWPSHPERQEATHSEPQHTPSLSITLFEIKAARIDKACDALKRAEGKASRGVRIGCHMAKEEWRAAAKERDFTKRMEAFDRASRAAEITLAAEQGRLHPSLANSPHAAPLRDLMELPRVDAQQARKPIRPCTRAPFRGTPARRPGDHGRGRSCKTRPGARSNDDDDGPGEPAGSSHTARCQALAALIERESSPFAFSYGELRIHIERAGLTADRPTARLVLGFLPPDFKKGAEIERWREVEDRRLEREWAVRS